ncbi:MAG: hypothetical protein HQ591_12935 [candidate division Zixibacteria bacterium]|nr:hypothetical protein [Candidatus Tariuqbacter arcticus]
MPTHTTTPRALCHSAYPYILAVLGVCLYKQLSSAKTPHEKTVIQRQIAAADKQIDRLVYELYELTEEEIKIVEED